MPTNSAAAKIVMRIVVVSFTLLLRGSRTPKKTSLSHLIGGRRIACQGIQREEARVLSLPSIALRKFPTFPMTTALQRCDRGWSGGGAVARSAPSVSSRTIFAPAPAGTPRIITHSRLSCQIQAKVCQALPAVRREAAAYQPPNHPTNSNCSTWDKMKRRGLEHRRVWWKRARGAGALARLRKKDGKLPVVMHKSSGSYAHKYR